MLEEREYEIVNNIIRNIYKPNSSSAMRKEALTQLKKVIDFKFSVFSLGLIKSKVIYLVDNVIVSNFEKSFEEKFIRQSESQYSTSDYASWIFQIQESIVYKDSEIVDNELRKKTQYYNDYLLANDLPNVAGLSIVSGKKFLGAMTLYKSERAGDFSEKEMLVLKLLLPHLESRLAKDDEKSSKNRKNVSYILKCNYNMTAREIEIMGLVFKGLTNTDIAEMLVISRNTVKKHLTHIYEKINISNRSQLIQFVHDHDMDDIMKL